MKYFLDSGTLKPCYSYRNDICLLALFVKLKVKNLLHFSSLVKFFRYQSKLWSTSGKRKVLIFSFEELNYVRIRLIKC